MKYIVICYSVHDKKISSYDVFEKREDAYIFLREDAKKVYEEEVNNSGCETEIEFTLDDEIAYLSSCNGEYEWTWEIIEVND